MSAAPFDLLGPLPTGTTVLEASAGTGKTYTIAGLVTRYVAEGVATIDQLLVVTFGRGATQELRERVRDRMGATREALRDPATARTGSDALHAFLAAGTDDEVVARGERLGLALISFDAATVATLHEFARRVLTTLGIAADVDADTTLVENFTDLIDEVVQDLYIRKWARGGTPLLTPSEAISLGREVVADGQAVLVPVPRDDDESPASVRWRFARAVRDEVELRKRRQRLLGFDDWLTRLRDALADAHSGPTAVTRLRDRYRIVLVDEFQDTDPVQWDILKLAFHTHATLVLIGDPKQAIYAFRGGDVHAYLAAVDDADSTATLMENWRSDLDLLRGLDRIFRGAALGDPRISVASASAAHSGRSLAGDDAPVRLRVIARDNGDPLYAEPARKLVVADLVQEIVALLDRRPRLAPRDGAPRALRPGDIAVIVSNNKQLDQVDEALGAAGVPAVQRSTRSVFRTPAAEDWIVLLEALEQPHRTGRVGRLAVSPFVGWDAADLQMRDVDALALRLRYWLSVYEQRGVAALFETVSRDERLPARLLGQVDGERHLTDLRHVAEALHAEAMRAQFGVAAGLAWLRRRAAEAVSDADIERSRRLDSDAEAVQLITVWASKGLEFPVVMVPFAYDQYWKEPSVPLFHENGTTTRVRNVGGPSAPDFAAHQGLQRTEDLGEHLRLLYVALTRAQSQVTAWWAPGARNTAAAPLHRLLFAAEPGVEIPESIPVPTDRDALARLSTFAEEGCLSVEVAQPRPSLARSPAAADPPSGELAAEVLGRPIDTAWRRTSYSALTAAVHDATPVVASEHDVSEKDDEPEAPATAAGGDELARITSPMDALPGGAAFGTLVHEIFEEIDTGAASLKEELRQVVENKQVRTGTFDIDPDVLVEALLPSLSTPLGPLVGDRRLVDIVARDRLVELDFELPLAGGDRPQQPSTLGALADVFRTHLDPGDPLLPYADQLADPVFGQAVLEGYLAGSMDAVLRADGRYVVVDYKTNRLGEPGRPLTAGDYRPAAMASAMLIAHYPLQALLYEVALHRFLQWRVADYDPDSHLGGALYLFLRGMCGPDVRGADGSIPGVFSWRPPAALVVAASDVLAGGAA